MRSLAAALAMSALFGVASCASIGSSELECPDPPLLAAGGDLHLGLSCAEAVTYEGETFWVGCAPVHRSRIGETLVEDGGRTRFSGARAAVGIPPSKVLLLEGGSLKECDRDDRLIASSDGFTRKDAGLLRVALAARNEDELAHKRAPWIVPGRNEVPKALRLEAAVSAGAITVTNRNNFAWRNCDQIQINDEEDEIWETGDYLSSLQPGASYTWPLGAFGGDHHGLEDLSEESLDAVRGKPFIIMCRAPRGLAFGRDML